MSLETQRKQLQRKKKEVTDLNSKKAKTEQEVAKLVKKINQAKKSISRTKTDSTIKNKLKEIERNQNKIAKYEKEIGELSKKIAEKERKVGELENKVLKEEDKLRIRKEKETNKREKELNSTINSIKEQHERLFKEIEQLPEKITILFLASNPINQKPLNLDVEAREIMEMIKKAEYRDSIEFKSEWAVRTKDVLQAINEHNPSIIHFSGHGSDDDKLILQDENGFSKSVSLEAIVQTMKSSSEGIRLAFFNTCFSQNQADAVVEYIEAAIGMTDAISDEAAQKFASQFYSTISFGKSVKKAYEQAKARLMIEGISEENTPQLYVNEEINADDIVIVKP